MSKSRYIDTKFWDDPYIIELKSDMKLLFLYLLTNPLTNPCGVYEISLKRMSFDTSLSFGMIEKALEAFQKDSKIYYKDNFIIITNFIKNQKLNKNMQIGVLNNLNDLPMNIKSFIFKKEYDLNKPFETLLNALNNLNLNSNLNLNIKLEPKLKKEPPQAATFQSLFERIESKFMDRELKNCKEDFFEHWTEKNPGGKKELWQMKKTFDINLRFRSWIRRDKGWYPEKWKDNVNDKKFLDNIPKAYSGWKKTGKTGEDNLGHITEQYERRDSHEHQTVWYCPECDEQFDKLKELKE